MHGDFPAAVVVEATISTLLFCFISLPNAGHSHPPGNANASRRLMLRASALFCLFLESVGFDTSNSWAMHWWRDVREVKKTSHRGLKKKNNSPSSSVNPHLPEMWGIINTDDCLANIENTFYLTNSTDPLLCYVSTYCDDLFFPVTSGDQKLETT